MTSANVINYRIEKNKQLVGNHRVNILCKSHFDELLKFYPPEDYIITAWGYDEEEEEWEGESKNLKDFLIETRILSI